MSEKVIVYTRFNLPPSVAIPNGESTKPTWHLEIDHLVKDGEIDLAEQIEKFRGKYNVKDLLDRFRLGDNTALGTPSGSYIDNSGVDTDYRAYTQVALEQKLSKAFESLPDDIRSNFTDISDFAKSFTDGSYIDRLTKQAQQSSASAGEPAADPQGGN